MGVGNPVLKQVAFGDQEIVYVFTTLTTCITMLYFSFSTYNFPNLTEFKSDCNIDGLIGISDGPDVSVVTRLEEVGVKVVLCCVFMHL